MKHLLKLLLLAAPPALLAAVGCLGFPCDSTQIYQDNACVPDPRLKNLGNAGTGGAPVGTLAGASSTSFGRVCTGDSDCSAPAPYCAVQPGKGTGYCSIEGCKSNAALCPAGWSCGAYTTNGFCMAPG